MTINEGLDQLYEEVKLRQESVPPVEVTRIQLQANQQQLGNS